MRIDRSRKEPSPPPAPPWDTQGLRDRLEGHSVVGAHVDELHDAARERITESEPRRRFRLFRR